MTPTTFLHTADWQLGKPFAGVEDDAKRALLQNERIAAIRRMAAIAGERRAAFVVVAGDLFDSTSPTKATVAAACSAIRELGIPVFVIPGNHDHGGAGSVWHQDFFRRESAQSAPNLHVLLKPEPVLIEGVALLPCPLLRRHESADPTAWLRTADLTMLGDRARVVLAHGSVVNFAPGSAMDDAEESDAGAVNWLDLSRLPEGVADYVALGDWHGTKQVSPIAWYPGTPESDRFSKGEDHHPGNVLVVEAGHGMAPRVEVVRTAAMQWQEMEFAFGEDADLDRLVEAVDGAIVGRVNGALLWLHLRGALGIEASSRLEQHLETWRARLIRLKLDAQVAVAPTGEEVASLAQRPGDPLISRVSARLFELVQRGGAEAAVAQVALRELYQATQSPR